MVKFTLSTLSALALALPLAVDLPFASAAHTNGLTGANAMRRHHARMANGHVYERSTSEAPGNAVLAKKMAQKKSTTYKIKKRGDGSVCKIRGSSSNSTTTASASGHSSTGLASNASNGSATAASSAWSSVLPTGTDSSSTFVAESWAAEATASSQASSVDSSSSQAAIATTVAIASTTSSSAAAAQTSSTSSYSGSYTHLIPNGKKAGISAGDSFDQFKDKIGWWYDWSADPQGHSASGVTGMNMLWGAGIVDNQDKDRLAAFKALSTTPAYIIGFEEPDCAAGKGSAGFDVATGISLWNELVGPYKAKGSILISPSMCKQAAESGWLGPFMDGVNVKPDIINLHINKNSKDGIMLDLDHYWNTYGLPMMVTELACVNDVNGFTPCEDQTEIDNYISTIVDILENDSRVVGYAFSSGLGLGSAWKLMASSSGLSATGQSYLNAVSKYH